MISKRNGLALLAWMLVGAGLRFWQLDAKTPWSDEWATLVFSLGRSFEEIPLDQLLSLEQLLAIARLQPASLGQGLGDVWRYLMTESTHPPLYFWLTHLWLRLWQSPGELVHLGVARSLSAWLGVAAIPAAYGLGYWVTAGQPARQRSVALLTAALMALSPFGVYLAQEARHYTLALLWAMASLCCFVSAWRAVRDRAYRLPWSLVLLWTVVNGLGLATHYFVGLLLASEGLALAGLLWSARLRPVRDSATRFNRDVLTKLSAAAFATLLTAAPWLPFWLKIPGDRLTDWISQDLSLLERWLMPLFRLTAWLASMVLLLPVEQVPAGVAVLSGIVLLVAAIALLIHLQRGLSHPLNRRDTAVEAILAVQGSGLVLVLAAIYLWQKDLSLATRYFFVFLPGTLLLLAIALTALRRPRIQQWLLALGFAGSLAVTTGYAFQKPDRPDLFVREVRATERVPVAAGAPALRAAGPPVVVTFDKTHEQLGEMLALAWEWQRQGGGKSYFLIAQRRDSLPQNTANFKQALASLSSPFTLWQSNLTAALAFPDFGCNWGNSHDLKRVPGYRYRSHSCRGPAAVEQAQ